MKKLLTVIVSLFLALAVLLAGVYYLCPGCVIRAGFQAARCKAGLTRKEITAGGHNWVYLEGGRGETVVMLHGFGMFKDFWGDLPAALTKNYRVIIPDLPGFGDSSRDPADRYDLVSQTARVREFTDKLGLEKFHLIGFSMGGGISACYASRYPERVKTLVLIDALGMDTPFRTEFEDLYFGKGIKPLVYRTVDEYDRMMALGYETPPSFPAHIKRYIVRLGAQDYDLHDRIFSDLGRAGMSAAAGMLPGIRARTLVLWGEKDKIFDAATAYAFANGIKDSRVVIIPGAGHMVYLEKPAESVDAVTGFLAGK